MMQERGAAERWAGSQPESEDVYGETTPGLPGDSASPLQEMKAVECPDRVAGRVCTWLSPYTLGPNCTWGGGWAARLPSLFTDN